MGTKLTNVVGIINLIDHPGFGPKIFNMYRQIQYLLSKIRSLPSEPIRPTLLTGANSDDIRRYADRFEIYEKEMAEFEAKKIELNKEEAEIYREIKALITRKSGLDSIPERYRTKVWNLAWNEGRSYYEVYQWLCKLVDIFE